MLLFQAFFDLDANEHTRHTYPRLVHSDNLHHITCGVYLRTWLLWRRLEYDFLACCMLLCLASYFSFFVFLFFLFLFFSCIPVCLSSCPLVCAAAICYSQQVRTPEYFIVRVLTSYFSGGGVFFVVLSYPVR